MGSDRGQLFRTLSPETAPLSGADNIRHALTPYSDEKTVLFNNPEMTARMRSGLRRNGFSTGFCETIYPFPSFLPNTKAYPLELQYFLFHPYDEREIRRTITERISWRSPEDADLHSHQDCLIHDAASFFFKEALGTTLTTGEVCVDVREGVIERHEALQTLDNEQTQLSQIQSPYSVLTEIFDISEKSVRQAERRLRRRMRILVFLRRLQLKFVNPRIRLQG
jgi:hypothetical protein